MRGIISDPDFEKVERLENREEWGRRVVFVGLILLIVGLFFPYAQWDAHQKGSEKIPAGSIKGVDVLNSDQYKGNNVVIPFSMFLILVAIYLSLRKEGALSLFFVMVCGLIVFVGFLTILQRPFDLVDPAREFDWREVESGLGLYLEVLGGLWVVITGLFALIHRLRVNYEVTPEPPY